MLAKQLPSKKDLALKFPSIFFPVMLFVHLSRYSSMYEQKRTFVLASFPSLSLPSCLQSGISGGKCLNGLPIAHICHLHCPPKKPRQRAWHWTRVEPRAVRWDREVRLQSGSCLDLDEKRHWGWWWEERNCSEIGVRIPGKIQHWTGIR